MSDQIYFFDTTLRDGEQCPGASMNLREKLEVARQMERLGMDVIEAGFPCISDGDFEAVHTIASEIKKCRIAGLARCVKADIESAARALEPAGDRARIHIFLATSKLHMQFKLKKAETEILRMAAEGVSYARQFVQDVEFSPEDASRTDLDFLTKVVETVIDAGATTVNIPDTVGYTTPDEFYRIIRHLKENVPNIGKAVISVHCHNDLGLAVANSLAAVRAGARQVEGTINGIGERAGNVALEEVIMALRTRAGQFGDVTDNINTREIVRTSRIVARMSGMQVQRSKAIVGENAFAHSSGIHQHGILNCRETYEVMDPQAVGWGATELPLTKHSGRAAVKARLAVRREMTDQMLPLFTRMEKILPALLEKKPGKPLVLKDGSKVRLTGMKGHLLTVEPQDSREGSDAYQVSWNELPFNSLYALARECRQKQPAEFSPLADAYSKPLLIFGSLTETISPAQQENALLQMDRAFIEKWNLWMSGLDAEETPPEDGEESD